MTAINTETILAAARGCHDYGGGFSGNEYEAFQHGIGTVVRVLEILLSDKEPDLQMKTLITIGSVEDK